MKNIILGVVGIAVIGAGVWYFGFRTSGTSDTAGETQTSNESQSAPRSITEAMASGGRFTCTFSSNDPNAQTSGTYYIDGKNLRGDFKSSVAGQGAVESNMIADATHIYTWSSAMPTGFKMERTDKDGSGIEAASGFLGGGTYGDSRVSFDYRCNPGGVSANTFVLPAGVQFMEAPAARMK